MVAAEPRPARSIVEPAGRGRPAVRPRLGLREGDARQPLAGPRHGAPLRRGHPRHRGRRRDRLRHRGGPPDARRTGRAGPALPGAPRGADRRRDARWPDLLADHRVRARAARDLVDRGLLGNARRGGIAGFARVSRDDSREPAIGGHPEGRGPPRRDDGRDDDLRGPHMDRHGRLRDAAGGPRLARRELRRGGLGGPRGRSGGSGGLRVRADRRAVGRGGVRGDRPVRWLRRERLCRHGHRLRRPEPRLAVHVDRRPPAAGRDLRLAIRRAPRGLVGRLPGHRRRGIRAARRRRDSRVRAAPAAAPDRAGGPARAVVRGAAPGRRGVGFRDRALRAVARGVGPGVRRAARFDPRNCRDPREAQSGGRLHDGRRDRPARVLQLRAVAVRADHRDAREWLGLG